MGARPFLKWIGGKRQLAAKLVARIPAPVFNRLRAGESRYYEPFVGGGALFFALAPKRATLGDANELLMRTYLGIRDEAPEVIRILTRGAPKHPYVYEEKAYYAHRARYATVCADPDDAAAAAWLIYMNRTGFNGLYRVSKKGNYNVPFGRYTNPTICDAEGLLAAQRALKRADLRIGAFEKTARTAETGDFVYFDPPYIPASPTADFTSYTSDGFGLDAHVRLRDCASALKKRGVHVMLSNADVLAVQGLYGTGFEIERVEARRNVNSDAAKRGPVGEVIIT